MPCSAGASRSPRWATKSLKTSRLRSSSAGVVADTSSRWVEGDAGEPLGLMRLVDPEQVVEPPHALGEVGLGEDPAATEAAQAIDLGQAVGADELRAEVHGAAARRDRGIEIDFVDQHPGADAAASSPMARNSSSSARSPLGLWRLVMTMSRVRVAHGRSTAAGSSRNASAGLRSNRLMSAPRNDAAPMQRLIGGMFDQHLVAGLDQCGHGEEIGHRGAVGGDDLLDRTP